MLVCWKMSASMTTDSHIVFSTSSCSTFLYDVTRLIDEMKQAADNCQNKMSWQPTSKQKSPVPLPIFFLKIGCPGHGVQFPQSFNFLEGGDAVSGFFAHGVSPSSLPLWSCCRLETCNLSLVLELLNKTIIWATLLYKPNTWGGH